MVRSWDARVRGATDKVVAESDAPEAEESTPLDPEAASKAVTSTEVISTEVTGAAIPDPEATGTVDPIPPETDSGPTDAVESPADLPSGQLQRFDESESDELVSFTDDVGDLGIEDLVQYEDRPQETDGRGPNGPERRVSNEVQDLGPEEGLSPAEWESLAGASSSSDRRTDFRLLEDGAADGYTAAPQAYFNRESDGLDPSIQPDLTAEMVIEGLSVAVSAVGLSMAVVDRSSGQILWSSEGWTTRFGVQDSLDRHWSASVPDDETALPETVLPDDEETWQRNRGMLLPDGSEELVELLMIGAATKQGVSFVTVVAIEETSDATQVTDRVEVIGVLDAALKVAAASGDDSKPKKVAVLYVDLDRFKVVHDLVGNVEAMRLLDVVSVAIRSTMRETDLFFRLPSDEYVVIASELGQTGSAEELADRVRLSVATISDLGHDLALTASVGVALADDNQNGDELLSEAETAVYLAKGRGRNRIAVHDEDLRARSQRLLVVERQLRRAIDRRDVRFAYQAVVDMPTGAVVGAEALLRLGGEVGLSAMEVITAAEHSGLMGALGSLVVEGVDEQLSDLLRSSETKFQVMVNLSGTQLEDEALLQTLVRLAEDPSIPAGRIAVEVPESVVEENRGNFLKLAELVRPKFNLGVDGFGVLMSSTSVLESLPIDYVKLHRTITTAPSSAGRDRVSELVAAANTFGVTTIALGVESLEQANVLQAVGCHLAQGFLYAGAVAAEDLRELIEVGFGDTAQVR